MNNKKLKTIRDEMKTLLAKSGQDPIAWLEEQANKKRLNGEGTDVYDSLKRVLEAGGHKNKHQ